MFTILGIIYIFIVPVVAQDCKEDEIVACLEPMLEVFQNISNDLITGDIDLVDLADTCPEYRRYQRCVSPRCLIPLFQDINQQLVEAFSYICDDIFSDIQRYRSCWTNPIVESEYIECGVLAAQITIANRAPCQFYAEIEACLEDVTQTRCGPDQASLITGYLNVAYTRQKIDLQCPTTTPSLPGQETETETEPDVSPEPPVRCWDCNSGEDRDSNPLCPVNGDLTTDLLTSVTCPDACFDRTDRWNKNIIYRGCSQGHYLPKDMERRGCIENPDEGVVWCFCSRDRCNSQDMSMFLEEGL